MDRTLRRVARRTAAELSLAGEREEEVLFGLRLLFATLLHVLALALGGWLLGILPLALVVFLVSGSLKVFAGGAHASTPGTCMLTAVPAFLGLAWLARQGGGALTASQIAPIVGAAALVAGVAILRYAPADVPEKPIVREAKRKALRRGALAALAAWALAGIAGWNLDLLAPEILLSIASGMAWQALILTPAGYRLSEVIDRTYRSIFSLLVTRSALGREV